MPEHLMADLPQKALIAHEGKVLLTCGFKGFWQPPGGRLHADERPLDGLRREIKEELDAEIEVERPFHTFVFTGESGPAHFVVVYLAKLTSPIETLKPDLNEMTEFRWLGPGEFEALKMREGYKEALRMHFHARIA